MYEYVYVCAVSKYIYICIKHYSTYVRVVDRIMASQRCPCLNPQNL